MKDFSERRVVILGGTSGIGLATAELAASRGAAVVVASRSRERVDAALERLPATAEGYAVDLSSEDATAAFFAEIGAFDHLAYTAGEQLRLEALDATDLTEARAFMETRLWGALASVKRGHRLLRPGGSIVLMSGSASARPQATWSLAAAICGATEAITRALAMELAPIRVNAVAPGVIRTDLWAGIPDAEREEMYRATAAALPVGRVGEAEDVAEGVLYLMSNAHTTGIVLPIDGGTRLV
jgi:NAD(P)-dependent dehydrogenase (short-subunit alcohol dehydrogenase family)